jgi:hypothetical protein
MRFSNNERIERDEKSAIPRSLLPASRYGKRNHGIPGKHGKVDEVGNNEIIERNETEQHGVWTRMGGIGACLACLQPTRANFGPLRPLAT